MKWNQLDTGDSLGTVWPAMKKTFVLNEGRSFASLIVWRACVCVVYSWGGTYAFVTHPSGMFHTLLWGPPMNGQGRNESLICVSKKKQKTKNVAPFLMFAGLGDVHLNMG